MLIVQPSPSTDRHAKSHTPLVFKLPPPPPQPNKQGNKKEKNVKDLKNDDEIVRILRVEELDASLVTKGNDTILSNEYTNLDDSDDSEEMSIDFTENHHSIHSVESDSNTSNEGGFFISDQSYSPKKDLFNGTISLDNSLNLSGNSNSNNSNDSTTELGAPPLPPHHNYGDEDNSADELGAPPPPPDRNHDDDSLDDLGTPPLPPQLDHTPDSSIASSASSEGLPHMTSDPQATSTQVGNILLLSYKPGSKDDDETAPALKEADIFQENAVISLDITTEEGEQVSPVSISQLNELDEVVSDLRELLAVSDSRTSVEETTEVDPSPVTSIPEAPSPPRVKSQEVNHFV